MMVSAWYCTTRLRTETSIAATHSESVHRLPPKLAQHCGDASVTHLLVDSACPGPGLELSWQERRASVNFRIAMRLREKSSVCAALYVVSPRPRATKAADSNHFSSHCAIDSQAVRAADGWAVTGCPGTARHRVELAIRSTPHELMLWNAPSATGHCARLTEGSGRNRFTTHDF